MRRVGLAAGLLLLALPGCSEYRQTGIASYYGHESGNRTANGERWNPNGLTAASWFLPFNTQVRVTNLRNGKTVIVRINDRGPHKRLHRLIDLSQGAARQIGLGGLGRVRVTVLEKKNEQQAL